MASEDWFLRLDPYNFDTEEDYYNFYFFDIKRGEKTIGKEVEDAQHNQD